MADDKKWYDAGTYFLSRENGRYLWRDGKLVPRSRFGSFIRRLWQDMCNLAVRSS